MKRIFSLVTVAAVMAVSCNTAPQPGAASNANIQVTDTLGLAQYQQYKAQNELMDMRAYQSQGAAPATTIVKYVPVRTAGRSASSSPVYRSTSSSGNTARAPQRKKISKAAKGAVIGGVAGAVGGAVINKKNRAVGAVIGGVIGAAGGYGIGRGMDKRDGRY